MFLGHVTRCEDSSDAKYMPPSVKRAFKRFGRVKDSMASEGEIGELTAAVKFTPDLMCEYMRLRGNADRVVLALFGALASLFFLSLEYIVSRYEELEKGGNVAAGVRETAKSASGLDVIDFEFLSIVAFPLGLAFLVALAWAFEVERAAMRDAILKKAVE